MMKLILLIAHPHEDALYHSRFIGTSATGLNTVVPHPRNLHQYIWRPLYMYRVDMAAPMDKDPMALNTDTSTSVRSEYLADPTITRQSTVASPPDENSSPAVKEEQHRASPLTKYLQHSQEGIYHLQEAVATTLFRASPALLASFVDPTVSSFKAIYQSGKQLVIWRKGNAVFVRGCLPAEQQRQVTDKPRSAYSRTTNR